MNDGAAAGPSSPASLIRQRRTRANLSQAALAERIEASERRVIAWENEEGEPNYENARRLAGVLGGRASDYRSEAATRREIEGRLDDVERRLNELADEAESRLRALTEALESLLEARGNSHAGSGSGAPPALREAPAPLD